MAVIKMKYSIYEGETDTLHFLAVPQDKKLFYYATSAGRESLKRDYFMEREDINIYMINYVVRGRGTLRVGERAFELRQGDLCFLHLAEHSIFFPAEDKMEIVYFHVLGGQTQEIYSAFIERGDYVLHDVPEKLMTDCFEKFSAAVGEPGGFYEQSRILYFLLTEILRLRDQKPLQKYPKLIDEVLCYILYKCPPPSPTDVAEHFGFSPIYLERLFKRHVGETMRSYILRQKYAFACRFLADTDFSVEEIARKVGYGDAKGLIVLFAKFGTLTPLAYRKQIRGR